MVDFVVAMKTVATGLTVLKELNQVDREFDKATLKLKVGELATALSAAQIALAEAQAEVQGKDAEIAALQESFRGKNEDLVEYRGFYYRQGEDGKPRGRPHCPKCLPNELIIMTGTTFKMGKPNECPECKTEIQATNFNFDDE